MLTIWALGLLSLGAGVPETGERNLLELPLAATQIPARDATVVVDGTTIRVATGHHEAWPGVTLPAPHSSWDLSKDSAIAAEIRNIGPNAVTVFLRVDNAGADGVKNCLTRQVTIAPSQTQTLRVALGRSDTILFGMRGSPPEAYQGIDPARITALLFFVNHPEADHQWEIRSLQVQSAEKSPAAFFPFIDAFGQYMHRDWPGKTHSLEELHQRGEEEAKDLAAHAGPPGWDVYGGWKDGPKLPATGRFCAEKYEGQWWLVDPEGHLFFSQGIDCVLELDPTPIDERKDWFRDFPGDVPEFREFLSHPFALHGHYAGKEPLSFSFAAANQLRKYGPAWRKTAYDLAHRRLRSWGLNTIGNWSDSAVYRLDQTPYVVALGTLDKQTPMLAGSAGYWGKFPDPLAPEFKAGVEKRLAQAAKATAEDAWCLGYFVDNELSWGDETELGLAVLQSPAEQPAKKTFVEDLKAKYQTIEKLNDAWGTKLASWENLLESRAMPDKSRAKTDLAACTLKIARAYFTTVKQALVKAASQRLYLGCRFAWTNPLAIQAAAESCDVLSFNIYQRDVKDFKLPGSLDRPVLIGEFHFGALDRGMFHPGLVAMESQAARADAYTTYVESALRHPNIVGCHWFKYGDEPTTGRSFDEENYQIGFVDVADTPYPETVAAARKLGTEIYKIRSTSASHRGP